MALRLKLTHQRGSVARVGTHDGHRPARPRARDTRGALNSVMLFSYLRYMLMSREALLRLTPRLKEATSAGGLSETHAFSHEQTDC